MFMATPVRRGYWSCWEELPSEIWEEEGKFITRITGVVVLVGDVRGTGVASMVRRTPPEARRAIYRGFQDTAGGGGLAQ